MKKLLILPFFASLIWGDSNHVIVKLTDTLPYAYTTDSGKKIKIERVQDTSNRLTDDYAKTSRPCPPFCIQPTKVHPDITNIAELEIIQFMQDKVAHNKGVIIDARLKSWFELETIPSAINIPFPVMQNADKNKAKLIFKILGMNVEEDGTWNFEKAKNLAVFCNGVWCEQSSHFISGMLKYNYPASKLNYYRSGFQGWKLLGLTTIVHKEIKK
jgi:rhodanese-related sulfurtransferase